MRIPKPVFVIIIVALSLSIVALSVIGIAFGLKSCSPIKNGSSESSKGEMLKLVLSPVDPGLATESKLDETKSALESRLDKTGINDYYVRVSDGEIIIEVPAEGSPLNELENIESLIADNLLEFRPGDSFLDATLDKNGDIVRKNPTGETAEKVLLDSSDIDKAEAKYGELNLNGSEEPYVEIVFNEKGKERFTEATREYMGKKISIWMDSVMITAPTVNSVISDGKAIISGNLTGESAKELADKINSQPLALTLKLIESDVTK